MRHVLILAMFFGFGVFGTGDSVFARQDGKNDSKTEKQEGPEQKSSQEKGQRRGQQQDDAPQVGDVAPVFTLKSLDGESETDLASFKGQKPVVLLFGSYT